MAALLDGRRVAILATDGVERVELERPLRALREAGAEVTLVSVKRGSIRSFDHLDPADEFPVDATVDASSATDFDALMLPGGVANPDALRTVPAAVEFVRTFVEMDRPVAAICHAPWLLVEADLVRGRTLTSWPSLRTDIRNAGGEWVDREVVVDQKLLTSRKPDDLAAFNERMLELFAAESGDERLDQLVEQTFPASDPLPPPSTLATGPADRRRRAREPEPPEAR